MRIGEGVEEGGGGLGEGWVRAGGGVEECWRMGGGGLGPTGEGWRRVYYLIAGEETSSGSFTVSQRLSCKDG